MDGTKVVRAEARLHAARESRVATSFGSENGLVLLGDVVLPAAGRYQDPSDPDVLRWWDGDGWTGHIARKGMHYSDLAGAVPQLEPVGDADRCVLGLSWLATSRERGLLGYRTSSSWDLRKTEDIFASFMMRGVVSEGRAAGSAWRFKPLRGFALGDRVEDLDTGEMIGSIRSAAGGTDSGVLQLVSGRQLIWTFGRAWQFGRPGDDFEVLFKPMLGRDNRSTIARFLRPYSVDAYDVEINWRGALPAERAMLCCLGLRLMILPFSARQSRGG